MIIFASIVSIILFAAAFHIFRIPMITTDIFNTSQNALMVLRNDSLIDDDKERLTQQASRNIFILFVQITWRLGASLAFPVAAILFIDAFDSGQAEAIVEMLLHPLMIVAGMFLLVVGFFIRK